MAITRRTLPERTTIGLGSMLAAPALLRHSAQAADPIKVGVLFS